MVITAVYFILWTVNAHIYYICIIYIYVTKSASEIQIIFNSLWIMIYDLVKYE